MDMLFLIPLAMTAILYVAMWYFRIGSNKMKERNVKDLVIGLAAFLALIPLHLLIGPLPTPHRAPYAIDAIEAAAAAMALGGVVTWFTGVIALPRRTPPPVPAPTVAPPQAAAPPVAPSTSSQPVATASVAKEAMRSGAPMPRRPYPARRSCRAYRQT